MNTKTLGESYEGCLSRDWEKLLNILESGERRAFIHTQDFNHSTKGILKVYHIGIALCYIENEVVQNYDIGAWFPPDDRKWVIEWIDKSVVGWFPTKEDFPLPAVGLDSMLELVHLREEMARPVTSMAQAIMLLHERGYALPFISPEPSVLEWEKREEVKSDIPELDYLEARYDSPDNWLVAMDGVFTYNIHIDGFWEIVGMHCDGYLNTALHDELAPHENFDTAKAAIHEWRVNHLNSIIKK